MGINPLWTFAADGRGGLSSKTLIVKGMADVLNWPNIFKAAWVFCSGPWAIWRCAGFLACGTILKMNAIEFHRRLIQLEEEHFPENVALTQHGRQKMREVLAQQLLPMATLEGVVAALGQSEVLWQSERLPIRFDEHLVYLELLRHLDLSGTHMETLLLDNQTPWYIRRDLCGLLSNTNHPEVGRVLKQVYFQAEEVEILEAALRGLVQQNCISFLPQLEKDSVLYAQQASDYFAHRKLQQLLFARGRLGDPSVLRQLLALQLNPWSRVKVQAHESAERLVERLGGVEAAVNVLDPKATQKTLEERLGRLTERDPEAGVRRWAMQALLDLGGAGQENLLVQMLMDPDWNTCKSASDAMLGLSPFPLDGLMQLAADEVKPLIARAWAAYTLRRARVPVDFEQFPGLRIQLTAQLPSDVLNTLAGFWAHASEPGTDPRWLFEGLLARPIKIDSARWSSDMGNEFPFIENFWRFRSVSQTLEAHGIQVHGVVGAGNLHEQGWGTYHQMEVSWEGSTDQQHHQTEMGSVPYTVVHQLRFSLLGPYVTPLRAVAWIEGEWDWDDPVYQQIWHQVKNGVPEDKKTLVKQVLEEQGWKTLPSDMLRTTVEGLNVYYFGARKPLPLEALLFYWQD